MKSRSYVLISGLILGLALSFLIANFSFAQDPIIDLRPPWSPNGPETIAELISVLLRFAFNLGLVIAPLMFVIAGILFLTSAGEPEKVKKAKSLFWYTILGLAIVLLARGIYAVIYEILRGE